MNIYSIIEHNKREGFFFFSDNNMRVFRSLVYPKVWEEKYFFISNKGPDMPREYAPCVYDKDTGGVGYYRDLNSERIKFSSKRGIEDWMDHNFGEKIRFRLMDVEAWRSPGGFWDINDMHLIDEDIYISEKEISTRKVLRFLRDSNFLKPDSVGKLTVNLHSDMEDHYIEIMHRTNFKPLYVLQQMPSEGPLC